jgi:hypothetical protein
MATFRFAGLRYSSPCSAITTIVTHIPEVFNRPSRINIRKGMPLAPIHDVVAGAQDG